MVIAGFIMVVLGLIVLFNCLLEDMSFGALVCGFIMMVGAILWILDVSSPIEYSEKTVITNNYNDVQYSEPVRIIEIGTEATRPGAIWNDTKVDSYSVEIIRED